MSAARGSWRLSTAWRILTALTPTRGITADEDAIREMDHAGLTRRLRVRFSESVRDLFRPLWIRLHR